MNRMTPKFKICPRGDCHAHGAAQPASAFGNNASACDGLSVYCRACSNAIVRTWKAANPAKVKAARKRYVARNRARNGAGNPNAEV